MNPQTIAVTAGAVEYTWPLTINEQAGKDITADVVSLALGTYTTPGTWHTPDVDTSPTPSSRVVQLLIGPTITAAAGDFYLWWRVGDTPETTIRRGPRITVT